MALAQKDWMMLEKFMTPSTINLFFDSDGRTLLHHSIMGHHYNEKYVKDNILKTFQKGADVMQESIEAGKHKLPVEIAVEYKKGEWTS